VRRLYGSKNRFRVELLERSEERIELESERKFRERGATTFKQAAWLLTREGAQSVSGRPAPVLVGTRS